MQILNLPRGEAVGTMLSNSIHGFITYLSKSQTAVARIQELSKQSWWLGKSNAKGKQQ